ncbi:MAG: hypothetical protein ACEQSE_04415 [Candidatus Aquirickettsiella gammari]
MDRTGEHQEFFGERGFTRIRVRNNAKGATTCDFFADQIGGDFFDGNAVLLVVTIWNVGGIGHCGRSVRIE